MKKLTAILMMVGVLLFGGISMEAKTTKKKAKARTSHTTRKKNKPLIVKNLIMFPPERGPYLCIDESILTSNGYKLVETKPVWDTVMEEWGEISFYKDTKGNTITNYCVWCGDTIFDFVSTEERDKFLGNWEEIFPFEEHGAYHSWGAHDRVEMEIHGNTVILRDEG